MSKGKNRQTAVAAPEEPSAVRGVVVAASVILLVLSAFLILAQSPLSPGSVQYPDTQSSLYLYIGSQLLDGNMPYRDIFDFHAPLVFLIDALGLLINESYGIWLLELHFLIATFIIIFVILNRSVGPVAAFITCLVIAGFIGSNLGGGNRIEEYALLFQALGLAGFLDCFTRRRLTLLSVYLIGLSVALTFWLKPELTAFWLPFLVAVLALLARRGGAGLVLTRLATIVFSAALVFVVMVPWLYMSNTLTGFYQQVGRFYQNLIVLVPLQRQLDALGYFGGGLPFVLIVCLSLVLIVRLTMLRVKARRELAAERATDDATPGSGSGAAGVGTGGAPGADIGGAPGAGANVSGGTGGAPGAGANANGGTGGAPGASAAASRGAEGEVVWFGGDGRVLRGRLTDSQRKRRSRAGQRARQRAGLRATVPLQAQPPLLRDAPFGRNTLSLVVTNLIAALLLLYFTVEPGRTDAYLTLQLLVCLVIPLAAVLHGLVRSFLNKERLRVALGVLFVVFLGLSAVVPGAAATATLALKQREETPELVEQRELVEVLRGLEVGDEPLIVFGDDCWIYNAADSYSATRYAYQPFGPRFRPDLQTDFHRQVTVADSQVLVGRAGAGLIELYPDSAAYELVFESQHYEVYRRLPEEGSEGAPEGEPGS